MGGQALAIWAIYYNVQPTGEPSRVVTTDADFIGSPKTAAALQRSLGRPWKLVRASPDDPGASVAKVYAALPEGIKQVDFLTGIIGLRTEDIQRRAARLTLAEGIDIRLLHPLDALESRLRNLEILPHKRNKVGVAQSKLAIGVARAFIEDALDSKVDLRVVRQAIKRIRKMALDTALANVAFTWGIDVLDAIPVARVPWAEIP